MDKGKSKSPSSAFNRRTAGHPLFPGEGKAQAFPLLVSRSPFPILPSRFPVECGMPTDFDAWFVHEILIHERTLMLFLQSRWPHRDELHDLRQEVYARVYESAV